MKIPRGAIAGSWALIFSLALAACKKSEPLDEAKAAGKTTADFPQITADIFKPMDGGIDLSPDSRKRAARPSAAAGGDNICRVPTRNEKRQRKDCCDG